MSSAGRAGPDSRAPTGGDRLEAGGDERPDRRGAGVGGDVAACPLGETVRDFVTDPTHLAVALAYERGVDVAPRVVAKGVGTMALAIRREARRQGVPVVEDRPLAWTNHAACEEGATVPPHLYQAVAQVLAFVYSLTPAARSLLDTHRMA